MLNLENVNKCIFQLFIAATSKWRKFNVIMQDSIISTCVLKGLLFLGKPLS